MSDYLLYILGGFNTIFVILGIFMVRYIIHLNSQVDLLTRDVRGMILIIGETYKNFGHLMPTIPTRPSSSPFVAPRTLESKGEDLSKENPQGATMMELMSKLMPVIQGGKDKDPIEVEDEDLGEEFHDLLNQ